MERINIDIGKAARMFGKSQDDILLFLANLCSEIPTWVGDSIDLLSHKNRVIWEKEFVSKIKPLITKFEDVRKKYEKAVEEDDTISMGVLQAMVVGGKNDNCPTDKLWQVRFTVTGDNLLQWLVSNNLTEKASTVIKFMDNIDILELMENLPQILKLQKYLVRNCRVYKSEVENMTIRDFSQQIEDTFRKQFIQMAETVLKTWNQLSAKVKAYYGGAEIKELPLSKLGTLHLGNTPAAFLFPARHGSGLCSLALARLLVDTHNGLVQSDLPPLVPHLAGPAHLVSLDMTGLNTLLLTHTHYTLDKGGVTKEEYDIEAVDKNIRERCDLTSIE